jgi:hypothetical protein
MHMADISQSIHNYMALVSYASNTYTQPPVPPASLHLSDYDANSVTSAQWFHDFRRLMKFVNPTSNEITSLLSLLSSSILNGTPLPPYLTLPKPYLLSQKLEAMDRDILSVRHIAEPGYAAFAVIQIATRCILSDLESLVM